MTAGRPRGETRSTDTSTLEVEFNHGGVYQYFMVPETVFREFMQADSLGTFLNTRIKEKYPYAEM